MTTNQPEKLVVKGEKPGLNRINSTSPQLIEIRKTNNNIIKKLILLTLFLTSLLLLATTSPISIYSRCHHYLTTIIQSSASALPATEQIIENVESQFNEFNNLNLLDNLEKRKEKEVPVPEFSTSTYDDGKITTFMFTTAPIVSYTHFLPS